MRLTRIIGCFFLICSIAQAAIVPIKVEYTEEGKEKTKYGSGFVVGTLKDESIVITAGHLFDCVDYTNIDVYKKSARLLHSEFTNNLEVNNFTDIAILAVKVQWTHQWDLLDDVAEEKVIMCGYVRGHITNISGGEISKFRDCIIGARAIPGQSGGPLLAIRNGKTVCVGIVTGRMEQFNLSVFTPVSTINERLNLYAKGWKK